MGCGVCKKSSEKKHAKLRNKYEVEGNKHYTMTLYHVTSPESAESIVNNLKMLRGQSGMFGGGIYFAETQAIAEGKAHSGGATIEAEVKLGYVLVCRQSEPNMTYKLLRKKYGCNSVKGYQCVTNPEYVVYNWAQVQILNVFIGDDLYYTADKHSASAYTKCTNTSCLWYKKNHMGYCRLLCRNPMCEFYHDNHLGNCRILYSDVSSEQIESSEHSYSENMKQLRSTAFQRNKELLRDSGFQRYAKRLQDIESRKTKELFRRIELEERKKIRLWDLEFQRNETRRKKELFRSIMLERKRERLREIEFQRKETRLRNIESRRNIWSQRRNLRSRNRVFPWGEPNY